MARISISVPDELKLKMDTIGESINWSEVAREAFENVIHSKLTVTSKYPVPYQHRVPTAHLDLRNTFIVFDGKRYDMVDLLRPLAVQADLRGADIEEKSRA
ncbi:hypothetical protein ACQKQD_32090 [Methylobacterium sp. NPDC080182]|uniref:hypothetical protein n=1 Tax=Methylobacterium sp. NPDC080182 TaxID=3390590 RepID=UPI003CFC0DF8